MELEGGWDPMQSTNKTVNHASIPTTPHPPAPQASSVRSWSVFSTSPASRLGEAYFPFSCGKDAFDNLVTVELGLLQRAVRVWIRGKK